MLKEDLEKAVLYSNICLKRWARNKTHLINGESIRSLVNGWIIKVLCRTSHQEWRMRKSLAKNISKTLFVTVDAERYCITSITVQNVVIPTIDYFDLDKQAETLFSESSFPNTIEELSLQSITNIKFN